jgi:hypothetical protein
VVVESRGLAGGQAEHAGFGGLPTKPSEDGFLVWASKPSTKAQHDGDGIRRVGKLQSGGHAAGSHGLRREDEGAAKACPSDGKTHKHYINAPTWVVSPVVELGVVESFPTPAGPDI